MVLEKSFSSYVHLIHRNSSSTKSFPLTLNSPRTLLIISRNTIAGVLTQVDTEKNMSIIEPLYHYEQLGYNVFSLSATPVIHTLSD